MRMILGGMVVTAVVGAACAQDAAPPQPSTPAPVQVPAPQSQPAKAEPRPITTADDLLSGLETADAGLRSLDADILYNRVFGLEGDEQERRGRLYYVDSKGTAQDGKPAAGSRKFAIHFKTLKMGGNPAMPQDQIVIFDGEWLIEKLPGEKQIVKRQITRAGQGFDPLKVGEGPFPLPVGQKRADILRSFDAVLLRPTEGLVANNPDLQKPLEKFVEGSYQLKLTPKKGDREPELSEIRLWYRPDPATGELLPRMARTLTPQGDVSIVQLVNVKLNQTVPPEVLDTTAPAGWKQEVQELAPEIRR